MIIGLDEYERFIRGILKKVPVLKVRQLVKALENNYEDMDSALAQSILFAIERKGYVLLSENGWAMTQGAYLTITNDRFFDGIVKNKAYRMPDQLPYYDVDSDNKRYKVRDIELKDALDDKQMQLIRCMYLVIDMLPDSCEFVAGEFPWNIMFVTEPDDDKKGMLYQIAYVPKRTEDIEFELMRNLPKVDHQELRDSVRRIVVLENDKSIDKVPYIGITHICKINERTARGYEVLGSPRKRTEAWKQYVV
ncbi:MAG: hypothetical protein IJI66_01760 [Erysipelotrichaceae bacterium]|nr:hypothetical protein [Erysipelotrichaceae bacterium]